MKFKALAIDLDGTLLVGERIPADNVVAVRAARDAGLKIIIATARWHHMALRIANELEISGPLIACSGAQVHLSIEDRDIFDERLPEDFVAELYKLCDGERCVATVTVADRVLLKLDGEPDRAAMLPEMRWVRQLTGAADSMPRVAAIQGGRVNARIRAELEPRYKDRVNFFDSIGPTGKIILMITAATASKGAALEAACRFPGYTDERSRRVWRRRERHRDVSCGGRVRRDGSGGARGEGESDRGDAAQRRSGRCARHRTLVGDRHGQRVAGIRRSLMLGFLQFHAAASGPYSCTRSCTELSES